MLIQVSPISCFKNLVHKSTSVSPNRASDSRKCRFSQSSIKKYELNQLLLKLLEHQRLKWYVTRRTNYDKVWGWTVFLFLGFIVTCVFLSSHVYNLKIITVVKTITYSPYPYNDSEKDLKSLHLYYTYSLFKSGYQ